MSSFNDAFLDGCSVDVTDDYDGPASRTLAEYWKSLVAEATPDQPRWPDIDLTAVAEIAPYIIVKDVILKDAHQVDYVNSYWGAGITKSFGIDAAGMEINDYYAPRFVAQLRLLYDFIFGGHKLVRLSGAARMFEGRDYHVFESVQIPIYGEDEKPAHILMAYDFSG